MLRGNNLYVSYTRLNIYRLISGVYKCISDTYVMPNPRNCPFREIDKNFAHFVKEASYLIMACLFHEIGNFMYENITSMHKTTKDYQYL